MWLNYYRTDFFFQPSPIYPPGRFGRILFVIKQIFGKKKKKTVTKLQPTPPHRYHGPTLDLKKIYYGGEVFFMMLFLWYCTKCVPPQ